VGAKPASKAGNFINPAYCRRALGFIADDAFFHSSVFKLWRKEALFCAYGSN